MKVPSVSIAIPTLDRGHILVETIGTLLTRGEGCEILVIDQTSYQPREVAVKLGKWHERGDIRLILREKPSIPAAMNVALRSAVSDIVLFLDDDVIPEKGICAAHAGNYNDPQVAAVAGQVIQPWQVRRAAPRPEGRIGIWEDLDFPFYSIARTTVRNCIACNFSVRREAALAVGGFDENFVGAGYRFETEFCRRLTRLVGKTVFDPAASVRHVKSETGGIRVYGDGVTTSSIEHSIGNYYFSYLESSGLERIHYQINSLCQATVNRYNIRHPWKIPKDFFFNLVSIRLAYELYQKKKAEDIARG